MTSDRSLKQGKKEEDGSLATNGPRLERADTALPRTNTGSLFPSSSHGLPLPGFPGGVVGCILWFADAQVGSWRVRCDFAVRNDAGFQFGYQVAEG